MHWWVGIYVVLLTEKQIKCHVTYCSPPLNPNKQSQNSYAWVLVDGSMLMSMLRKLVDGTLLRSMLMNMLHNSSTQELQDNAGGWTEFICSSTKIRQLLR